MKNETEEKLLSMAGTLVASVILFVVGFAGGFMLSFRFLYVFVRLDTLTVISYVVVGLLTGIGTAIVPFTMKAAPGSGTLREVRRASRKRK
ncbi:MAG: hypothetical protein R6V12_13910 [Candidatus Hydrogenedentota bacterium]